MARTPEKPRGLFAARVVANTPICREHYRLTIRIGGERGFPPSWPGQFVQIGCRSDAPDIDEDRAFQWRPGEPPVPAPPELDEPAPFLRRPYSIAGRRDAERHTDIDIIYRVVGLGTTWLERLTPDDELDVIGPLGNTFTLPPDKSVALLVGGGVGLPPMFYLAEAVRAAGWSGCAFIGAVTGDLLAIDLTDQTPDASGSPVHAVRPFADAGLPTVVTTDDGSVGLRGLITDGLRQYLAQQSPAERAASVIYTCGPNAMMQAVAGLASAFEIDCQACVEQAMACGMGTCQSCIIRIRDEQHPQGTLSDGTPWRFRLACTEGPVFPADQVIW